MIATVSGRRLPSRHETRTPIPDQGRHPAESESRRAAGRRLREVAARVRWFGLGHYANQGAPGVRQATITGLVYGGMFVASGRIWLPMIVHSAYNLTAYALIYRELEVRVAHSFFA